MKKTADIRCPECGKVVGFYFQTGSSKTPIGSIATIDCKLDHRKASRIFKEGRTNEPYCRACAKKIYPDGQVYEVYFYPKKGVYPFKHGSFSSRADAEAFINRKGDNPYGKFIVNTKAI